MRINFKYDLAVKDLEKTIKNIESHVPEILNELGQVSVMYIQKSIEAVQPYPPVDTGDYKNLIHYKVEGDTLTTSDGVLHGVYIERGSPPRWLPIKPIIEWCKRKKMILNDDVGVAYAIQAHIAKYGIPPKPVFKTGCQLASNDFERILRKYYG